MERNFINRKNGSQEDSHSMQTLWAPFVPCEVQKMFVVWFWRLNKVTAIFLDDSVPRLAISKGNSNFCLQAR